MTMHDVEERLADTLHWRADDEVDADRLLGAAVTRGRVRRRRRRLAGAACGAGLAGLMAAALAAGPLLGPGDGAIVAGGGPDLSTAEVPTAPPEPPANVEPQVPLPATGDHEVPRLADNAPGIYRAEDVGTDPFKIHFAFDRLPAKVTSAVWKSGGGVEAADLKLEVPRAEPVWVNVAVAYRELPRSNAGRVGASAQVGNIAGRPVVAEEIREAGTVQNSVRWSPAAAVEARVLSGVLSFKDLFRVAKKVRMDRSTRCTLPARLTGLPAGWAPRACEITMPPDELNPSMIVSQLTVGPPKGAAVDLAVARRAVAPDGTEGARRTLPGGVKVVERTTDGEPSFLIYDLDGRMVDLYGHDGATRDEAVRVAGGLRAAGDPDQPGTWPPDPVG